jgi:glutathione S-transferase
MMKLFWSSRSPFARKVVVAAHELGIADQIALERVVVSAKTTNAAVTHHNALGKIPTLLLEDGTALFDSPVILAWLDAQFGGGRLVPLDGRRWTVARLEAMGDGLMDLSVARLGEVNRGPLRSAEHYDAFVAKIRSVLDWLEQETALLEPLSAGSIAVATGLAHLDFRFAEEAWRTGRPRLAAWFDAFAQRPSMRATQPEDVY